MSGKLKAGVRVKVYQRPLTDEDFEGEATLVKQVNCGSASDAMGWGWEVRFDGDQEPYYRRVFARNIVEDKRRGA